MLEKPESDRTQRFTPIIPALWEPKADRLLESKNSRPAWATKQDLIFTKKIIKKEKRERERKLEWAKVKSSRSSIPKGIFIQNTSKGLLELET